MVSLDDMTNFSGEEGEDALKWYKNFINATITLGETGMLSNFPLFMEPDSPAQMWCDDLPKEVFLSWTDLDRSFRRTWLHHGGGNTEAMEHFQNHYLTDDSIFAPKDAVAMNRVIADWAQNHARLGDEALVQATLPNLPVFIRAFLKYNSSPPTTFKSLCERITEITDPILEFEQLRRQERSADWQARAAKKQPEDDPKVAESHEVHAISFFPSMRARRTETPLSKAEMAEIVKEAIKTLRRYRPSEITIDAARMLDIGLLHYCKAVEATAQFEPNTIVGQAGTKSVLWEGIFQINYQNSFSGSSNVAEVSKTWESFSDSSSTIQAECIYKPNHTCRRFPGITGSGTIPTRNTPYYGGFVQVGNGSTTPSLGVSSSATTLYTLLSAYLAEGVTVNRSVYIQAAIESANWVKKWAYDDNIHLAKIFYWDMYNCQAFGTSYASPHITGLYIEALCVLASVTGEQQWRDLVIDTCNAAMVHRDWHDHKGVFKYVSSLGHSAVDDSNTFRGLLFRGLSVAYHRNPSDGELRQTIRNYINLQFSALRDKIDAQGSYPVAWNAPSGVVCAHGQMAALEVLMAAVIVNHY